MKIPSSTSGSAASRKWPGILVVLAVTTPCAAQTKLEWKFEKNQEIRYELEQTSDMQMTGGPVSIAMTQSMIMDIVMKVTGVNEDGSAEIAERITRTRVLMEGGPFGTVKLDSNDDTVSENPAGQMFAGVMKAMVGPEFKLRMNKQGKVVQIEIPAEVKQALAPVGQIQGGFLSEAGLKKMFESSIPVPEAAVSLGDSWKHEEAVQMGPLGTVHTTTTCTYGGLKKEGEKALHRIDMKLAMRLDEAGGKENNALKVTKMEQDKSSGYLLFDNVAGRIEKTVTRQNLTMEIEIDGRKMEQKTKSRVTLKLVPEQKPAS